MDWIALTTENQFKNILEKSFHSPQLIYKHSYACGVSARVKKRLEKTESPDDIDFYFLDILTYRSLSNHIATELMVEHESPQVLLLKNGNCVYEESHFSIQMSRIRMHSVAA